MQTAHKTDEEKKEFFDSEDVLDSKVDQFIQMLKTSKHFIAFTGAGISTSAGIPDFRSGINTVLPTGPGCWEKLAQNQKKELSKKTVKTSTLQAIPTKCHMALVELEEKGYLKYLVSQNTDGLHRRSGYNPEKLAELHGNTNLEICKDCKRKYLRDFRCRTANKVLEHKTNRKCENCKGDLYDSIINFGENLPEKELNESFEHAERADLCLAMGSSLRVTPAANIPETVGIRKKNLVIVNLQKTPLDKVAALRVNALCDVFIEKVMKKLNLDIPEFRLKRHVGVKKLIRDKKEGILVQGIDIDGLPYSIFKSVSLEYKKKVWKIEKEPYFFNDKFIDYEQKENIMLILEFNGHYGEPTYKLSFPMESLRDEKIHRHLMEYSPKQREWVKCVQLK